MNYQKLKISIVATASITARCGVMGEEKRRRKNPPNRVYLSWKP
jgi:hypothetical protein